MAAAPNRRPKSPAYPGSFPPRPGKIHPISPPCPAMPRRERGTLHPCPGARIPTKLVIANQCAHWCGNPFSPQRSLASWLLFGQIRDALRMRPKCCYFAMPHRRRSGLPRRFAPRNDMQKFVAHTRCKDVLPRLCIHPAAPPCNRAHVLPSACHCEPVRTLVRQSASPQRSLASWLLFGQIRDALRMRPKCCYFAMPHRRGSGLPRRSAPRNDMQKFVAHTRCKDVLPRLCIHPAAPPCTRAHVLPSACHCEPVRTLVWQSASPG